MTDKEKLVYDLFCKWGELDANEIKEKIFEEQKYQDALDHLCELGYISMASVTEEGVVKLKWIVDKLYERVKDNSAYHFLKKY